MRRLYLSFSAALVACAGQQVTKPAVAPSTASTTSDSASRASLMRGGVSTPNADPFPSTYKPFASRPTLIRNVTILTAAGPTIRNGSILMQDGKIAEVGASVSPPANAILI